MTGWASGRGRQWPLQAPAERLCGYDAITVVAGARAVDDRHIWQSASSGMSLVITAVGAVSIHDAVIRLGQGAEVGGVAGSGGKARALVAEGRSGQRGGRDAPRTPAAAWRCRRAGQRGGAHR